MVAALEESNLSQVPDDLTGPEIEVEKRAGRSVANQAAETAEFGGSKTTAGSGPDIAAAGPRG